MKDYEVQLDPVTNSRIKLKLYRDVKNVPELRKKIMSGELRCCVVKPALIVDPFQVVVAANKALVAQKQGHMVTRSPFSETLFNLSTSKNVSKSLPLFGIDDNHSTMLVAMIDDKDSASDTKVFDEIQGEEIDMDELCKYTDVSLVKKVYNISDEEQRACLLLDTVVNRTVTKEC